MEKNHMLIDIHKLCSNIFKLSDEIRRLKNKCNEEVWNEVNKEIDIYEERSEE